MENRLSFERVDELFFKLKEIASNAFRDGTTTDRAESAIYKQLMNLGHELNLFKVPPILWKGLAWE